MRPPSSRSANANFVLAPVLLLFLLSAPAAGASAAAGPIQSSD